ncbi:MAG TPA: hypothetical protein VIP77_23140 [Jiangellaceae bacterium]
MSGTTPAGDDESRPDPYAAPTPGNGSVPPQPRPYGEPSPDAPQWTDSPAASPYAQAVPEPPQPIITAARLMWAGAALQLVGGLGSLLTRDQIRENLADTNSELETPLSPSQIDASANILVGGSVTLAVIAALIWLWMASANKKGRSWARVTATVLGGLNIVTSLWLITTGGVPGGINAAVTVIPVLIAAIVLYLLYRPESSAYYSAVSQLRLRVPR